MTQWQQAQVVGYLESSIRFLDLAINQFPESEEKVPCETCGMAYYSAPDRAFYRERTALVAHRIKLRRHIRVISDWKDLEETDAS